MKLILKSENSAIEHGEVICAMVQGLIDQKLDFQAFIALSTGIEYLGAFLDNFPFSKYGKSELRFTNALKLLFQDKWYHDNALWMFQQVRGPLIHQCRTGDSVLLTSNCVHKIDLAENRKVIEGKTQLVLEQLFEDFKSAYAKLKVLASENTERVSPVKRDEPFSAVYSYSEYFVSGTVNAPPYYTGTTATAVMMVKDRKIGLPAFKKLKKKKRRK
ncbi:MAG: hypothetical protein L6Q81_05135 [Bacteroidia bacterium]|nr:hypothetical protein [Bacteroidia bacterium]